MLNPRILEADHFHSVHIYADIWAKVYSDFSSASFVAKRNVFRTYASRGKFEYDKIIKIK